VSGLVSAVFVYKSSVKMMAPISNCIAAEQRAVICSLWSEGIKTYKAGHPQQAQKFALQRGSFAPQKCASAFHGSYQGSTWANEI
jgi:hypothetical protein